MAAQTPRQRFRGFEVSSRANCLSTICRFQSTDQPDALLLVTDGTKYRQAGHTQKKKGGPKSQNAVSSFPGQGVRGVGTQRKKKTHAKDDMMDGGPGL